MGSLDLFVYGTLMVPAVIRGVCGYRQPGQSATLAGYRCRLVEGEVYPAIMRWPGERVSGLLYRGLSGEQTALLDRFEGEMYERKTVSLSIDERHVLGEAYVLREHFAHSLSDREWTLQGFIADGIQRFTSEYQGFDRASADRRSHD